VDRGCSEKKKENSSGVGKIRQIGANGRVVGPGGKRGANRVGSKNRGIRKNINEGSVKGTFLRGIKELKGEKGSPGPSGPSHGVKSSWGKEIGKCIWLPAGESRASNCGGEERLEARRSWGDLPERREKGQKGNSLLGKTRVIGGSLPEGKKYRSRKVV